MKICIRIYVKRIRKCLRIYVNICIRIHTNMHKDTPYIILSNRCCLPIQKIRHHLDTVSLLNKPHSSCTSPPCTRGSCTLPRNLWKHAKRRMDGGHTYHLYYYLLFYIPVIGASRKYFRLTNSGSFESGKMHFIPFLRLASRTTPTCEQKPLTDTPVFSVWRT